MNEKKIEKFIDKQKISFICSIDEENYPNVKEYEQELEIKIK